MTTQGPAALSSPLPPQPAKVPSAAAAAPMMMIRFITTPVVGLWPRAPESTRWSIPAHSTGWGSQSGHSPAPSQITTGGTACRYGEAAGVISQLGFHPPARTVLGLIARFRIAPCNYDQGGAVWPV